LPGVSLGGGRQKNFFSPARKKELAYQEQAFHSSFETVSGRDQGKIRIPRRRKKATGPGEYSSRRKI